MGILNRLFGGHGGGDHRGGFRGPPSIGYGNPPSRPVISGVSCPDCLITNAPEARLLSAVRFLIGSGLVHEVQRNLAGRGQVLRPVWEGSGPSTSHAT